MLQCSPARTGSQHYCVLIDTNILRVHYLIRRSVLQNAILMNTRRMSKRILTHNSLIRLYRHIHQRRDHSTCRPYLLRVDISLYTKIRMSLEYHCYFLKRSFTCSFTNTIYCHLYLPCTIQYTSTSVSSCHTKVIMTMR